MEALRSDFLHTLDWYQDMAIYYLAVQDLKFICLQFPFQEGSSNSDARNVSMRISNIVYRKTDVHL